MKRALKKRVKAVLKNTPSNDDAPLEPVNIVNPTVKRRGRTRAAVIGLAISMGATSLLVTRQSDQAQAAAPVGSQKAASAIPAAPDTEVKFAPTKLKTQTVSSASVPENPVIVEPTAISQLPGLEAKLQVAASGMPTQVPTSETFSKTAVDKNSVNQQSQLLQALQRAKQSEQTVQKLSSADSVADPKAALQKAEPQTQQAQQSTVASSEVDAQLKAQQEFALNNLQEKSNRLRKSLAKLGSEESKNLPKPATELAQVTTTEAKLPPLSANSTVIEQSPVKSEASKVTAQATSEPVQQLASTPAPAEPKVAASSATTAYEVKPGDTLAAIASKYNTSVAELVKANNLTDPNQLKISQRLIIPAAQAKPKAVPQTIAAVSPTQSQASTDSVVATFPANTPSVIPNLSATSQLPLLADNSSISIPIPQAADKQIETNTALSDEKSPEVYTPNQASANVNTNGVGGDTPVPRAIAQMQQRQKPGQDVAMAKNERLRSLQAEIQRLQQKYRAQQSGNVVVPAATDTESNSAAVPIPVASPNMAVSRPVTGSKDFAVPIPVPSPLTPSYSNQPNNQYRAVRPNDEPINPEFLPNQSQLRQNYRNTSRTRIATPPIGVNASDSLGRMRGTTVSPKVSLPPLAAVDQYLPKPIDETIPPPSASSVAYIWPAKGVLTSGYGWRWGRMHKGIDVANATGTPVYASADGVIETAGWNKGGYGNLVDIRHPDGSMTRYGHNSKILVKPGQEVRQGETIALMGSTGFSTGPHSHFEIHPTGKGAVNPIAMLPRL